MTASVRTVVTGAFFFGGLLGGAIGAAAGLRTALWVAAAGGALSMVWVLASPVRALEAMPEGAAPRVGALVGAGQGASPAGR